MIGNGIDGRRDNNAASILVVERDGLLVLERRGSPVVQLYIQLVLRLSRCLYDLLIGERLVLVERQTAGQISSSVKPFVTILLLGILL